jgi:hypothetical protein
MATLTTCSVASKKKNLDTMKVLTSMTDEAAITASSATMLRPRMIFKMTYPAPAREPKNLIVEKCRNCAD